MKALLPYCCLAWRVWSADPGSREDVPWTLETLVERVPPLEHDVTDRWPMITWEHFTQKAGDNPHSRGEPLPAEMYRALASRGMGETIQLHPKYIPMAGANFVARRVAPCWLPHCPPSPVRLSEALGKDLSTNHSSAYQSSILTGRTMKSFLRSDPSPSEILQDPHHTAVVIRPSDIGHIRRPV